MQQRTCFRACTMNLVVPFILCAVNGGSAQNLKPVAQSELCVTEGSIQQLSNNQLQVSVPAMRAYLNALTPQSEEVQFAYRGATQNVKALGSGTVRSQFGLKLHAGDACNLVYVMWRIEPDKKIVISVKSNPGQQTSAQCGNRGYTNIKPSHSAPTPVVNAGEAHTLRAEMNGVALQVYADGKVVWQGSLSASAAALPGPVGIRSDNAALKFELLAPAPGGAQSGSAPACNKAEGD
jgi:hypothetical protein